jgi:hypothetical protein
MSMYLRSDDVLMVTCPHGGQVKILEPTGRTWLIPDKAVLVAEDVTEAPILDCPLPLKKCTKVVRILKGKAAEVDSDGLTPLTSDLMFLTDSGPPGIGFPVGAQSEARVLAGGAAPPAAAPQQAPAQKKAKRGQKAKAAKKRKKLRLKLLGWPGALRPPRVVVTVGQEGPERVEVQTADVPGGGEVVLAFAVDPDREAWAVISSHPLDNALEQIEAEGVEPRVVVGPREAVPLLPEFAGKGVSSYAELSKSGGPKPRLLHLLHQLPAERGIGPPEGGVVRPAVRLAPGPESVVELEPSYPALLVLEDALWSLERALREPLQLMIDAHVPERVLLARFCDGLESKYRDAFARTGTSGAPYVYKEFLRYHDEQAASWLAQVNNPAMMARQLLDNPQVWTEYERFVAASPFFLGTRDEQKTAAKASDRLLELFIDRTCNNRAVLLLREALRLLCAAAELYATLYSLDHEPVEEIPESWRPWTQRIVEQWGFPKSGKAGKPPISGWDLLSKLAYYLGKKALAGHEKVEKWVEETLASTLTWGAAFENGSRTPGRVLKLVPASRPAAPAEKPPRGQKQHRKHRKQQAKAAKRAASEGLPAKRRAFAIMTVLSVADKFNSARGRKWDPDDRYGFLLDSLQTGRSAVELGATVVEYYTTLASEGVLAKKGKLTGTAKRPLLRVPKLAAVAKKVNVGATIADSVLGVMEAVPDFRRGDNTRGTLRLVSAGLALCALAAPGFLPALGLFLAGAVLDSLIASLALTDEERDLRDLLRGTEFGVDGYSRADGPAVSAVSNEAAQPPAEERRHSPVRNLYESGGEVAPVSPKNVRDHLLGLPWRAMPALLPLGPDSPGEYVQGVAVRLMPLPALSPVSQVRLPGRLLLRQETKIAGERHVRVTITLMPPTGPAGEPIEVDPSVRGIREEAPRIETTSRGCAVLKLPNGVVPVVDVGDDVLLFVPQWLERRTTVISDLWVRDGGAVYVALGPHEFGGVDPDEPECRFDPNVARQLSREELREFASRKMVLEIVRRDHGLKVVSTKSAPPGTILHVETSKERCSCTDTYKRSWELEQRRHER